MTKSVKKLVILLVAVLMCATVVFAACDKNSFKPVSMPADATPESNGGIAVRYGEWLYYVNGYNSDVTVENTYTNDVVDAPRIGSVVRIKLDDIKTLLEINEDDSLKASEKLEAIANKVREKAETVVPKVYYSANTTTTQFTGIYIFNNRLYLTTPNDELTASGEPLNDQLVLMSFKLDGSDPQRHFTFTKNNAQIWLTCDDQSKAVTATYFMDNVLHTLDVANGKDTVVTHNYSNLTHIDNTVSSLYWDEKANAVFFIDEFGSICKLSVGATEYEVVVENEDAEIHNHDGEQHIDKGDTSYTISFVNDGMVYYTVDNGKTQDGIVMYWATDAENKDNVALSTNEVTVNAWKGTKMIVTKSVTYEQTYYGIWIVDTADPSNKKMVLSPAHNIESITINKIDGDTLYYTANGVSYTIDLNAVENDPDYDATTAGKAYAKNLASTTGWAAPDFIDLGDVCYIISATTDAVTLTVFDGDLKGSTVSIALTLKAAEK